MKLTKLALATAVMLPLAAQAGVTISPMATYQGFEELAESDVLPSVGLGYKFENLPLAVEGVYTAGEVTPYNSGTDVDVEEWRADLKYFLPAMGKLETYLAAGGGQIYFDSAALNVNEEADTVNGGAGMIYNFTDAVGGFLDSRYMHYDVDGNNIDDFLVSVGLQANLFRPAQAAPVVVVAEPTPEPVVEQPKLDSDGDGVYDDMDKCPATPANFAVDADGCPIEVVKPVSIPVRILFDFDKSNIKPEYQDEVAKVAEFMTQFPTASTVIEGHTDAKGSDEYNQGLSQRRADSVRESLVQNYGIDGTRLSTVGYGETQPVASNDTDAGRAQNRRVVAVVAGEETTMQER